jgi:hypothetical protein
MELQVKRKGSLTFVQGEQKEPKNFEAQAKERRSSADQLKG